MQLNVSIKTKIILHFVDNLRFGVRCALARTEPFRAFRVFRGHSVIDNCASDARVIKQADFRSKMKVVFHFVSNLRFGVRCARARTEPFRAFCVFRGQK